LLSLKTLTKQLSAATELTTELNFDVSGYISISALNSDTVVAWRAVALANANNEKISTRVFLNGAWASEIKLSSSTAKMGVPVTTRDVDGMAWVVWMEFNPVSKPDCKQGGLRQSANVAQMGVQLIDRARKPLQFRPVAKDNQLEFRQLVARIYEFRAILKSESLDRIGITIAAQHTLAATYVPGFLVRLQGLGGEQNFRIRSENRSDSVSMLISSTRTAPCAWSGRAEARGQPTPAQNLKFSRVRRSCSNAVLSAR
jgi:hypothetical protein